MSLSGNDDAENDWRSRNALDMGQEGMTGGEDGNDESG